MTIESFEKSGGKGSKTVEIQCKDLRTIKFRFDKLGNNRTEMRNKFVDILDQVLFPDLTAFFAFYFVDKRFMRASLNGWKGKRFSSLFFSRSSL